MNRIFLRLFLVTILLNSCNSEKNNFKSQKEIQNQLSQYVIQSNTMIFYDRKIQDAIKSRKFYNCIDVYNSNIKARITELNGKIKNFRVISFVYNERQILDIDLRQGSDFSSIEFYLLGYFINKQPNSDLQLGGSILNLIKPNEDQNIEIFINGFQSDLSDVLNMQNDARNVMADQIVNKKDNVGFVPYRRMNVLNSEIYAYTPTDKTVYRVVEIYRPAELDWDFDNPPVGTQARWFVTALAVDENKLLSKATLKYIRNPFIIESN